MKPKQAQLILPKQSGKNNSSQNKLASYPIGPRFDPLPVFFLTRFFVPQSFVVPRCFFHFGRVFGPRGAGHTKLTYSGPSRIVSPPLLDPARS